MPQQSRRSHRVSSKREAMTGLYPVKYVLFALPSTLPRRALVLSPPNRPLGPLGPFESSTP